MREIKFRAWDKEYKSFMEIVSLDIDFIYQNKKHIAVWRKPYKFENSNAISFRAKVNQTILIQYTGLKDKNDVEIYEGDIVKDTANEIYKIKYEVKKARFVYFHIKSKDKIKMNHKKDLEDGIEVIGNIYENLELLNK